MSAKTKTKKPKYLREIYHDRKGKVRLRFGFGHGHGRKIMFSTSEGDGYERTAGVVKAWNSMVKAIASGDYETVIIPRKHGIA